jgi:hypothetical protein
MMFWTALDAPPPSENEDEADSDGFSSDTEEAAHAAKKVRFEGHR